VLWVKDGKLAYNLVVGPMTDPAMRRGIVTKLLENCDSCGLKRSKAGKVKENWSNISSVEYIIEWGEDNDPDSDEIAASANKSLDDLYPKLEKLALYLKPLCKLPASAT
jgi:hypothetical protein